MQIGRNEPCPCGSGKKFKKCCIDKPKAASQVALRPLSRPPRGKQQPSFFDQYDSVDLLTATAALSILPENHGKAVRMLDLADNILAHFHSNGVVATPAALERFLAAEYPSHHLEDIPSNLFTDSVTFYGGDYLIFPGIIEGGSFVPTNLITAIYHWPNAALPDQFKTNCHNGIQFILSLSDLIAKRLDYTRYQPGTATGDEIFLPQIASLAKAKTSTFVSKVQMQHLLTIHGIDPGVISEFTFSLPEFQANTSNEESYLWLKPILMLADGYLVVSPLTMSNALTKFIWRQAKQWKCEAGLTEAYQNVIWNTLQLQLRHMGFKHEDVEELPAIGLKNKCGVYRFDEDKVAYVELLYGTRSTAQKGTKSTAGVRRLAYSGEMVQALHALPKYTNCQLLSLQLLSLDGTDVMLELTDNGVARQLAIPVHEFEVLSTLGESDAIDLWKFTLAQQALRERSPVAFLGFSFLDQFHIYQEHDDSFYFSDEARPNLLFVPPGYAAELVAAAKLKTDHHSAPVTEEGHSGRILVQRKDKYGPVYYNINDVLSSQLRFLVSGYQQPVWVEPATMPDELSSELRSWFYEITDAIAYWLWQIQDGLKPHLDRVVLPILRVTFDCQPLNAFAEVARDFTRVDELASYFQTSATADTAHIVIPAQLLPYLYGSDNEGERVLVQQLLVAINTLLANNQIPLIPAEAEAVMIAEHVPLGMKKKVFMLDTADNLLVDPRNLVPQRTVQEYDTSVVLDAIVPALQALSLCPPEGELATKAEKEKLTRDIVMRVLLPRLKTIITRYNQEDLLQKLLSLNESLIYHREKLRIVTPSRIACFVGIDQQVLDVKKELTATNRTSIAVRCLIEHISAEQTTQGASASTTDIDEMVALMDQILSWGSLGDQITHDLFDIKMSILPTQRIGTEKTPMRDVLDPYFTAKTQEDVSDAVKYYDQVFPQQNPREGGEVPSFIDQAFLADFAISFSRLCEFIETLVLLAFKVDQSVVAMPKAQLEAEIANLGYEFGANEFEAAISYLSLVKRDKVEKPPKGFDNFDITPWRFNRRLSLLRKPLVAFENPQDASNPVIYWGFRQALGSRIYLNVQIQDNRLRVAEGGEVSKALGKIAGKRGAPLVKKIAARLAAPGRIIDTEVCISPSAQLKHDKDIGDVDVLVIEPSTKQIFSLECKNMAPSRNIKEMVEELGKLIGSESEKGWMQKHVTRHEWLKQHLKELGKKYGLDLGDYTVSSFMVTAEDMLTPHLKKQALPLPFATAYAIEKDGLGALIALQ